MEKGHWMMGFVRERIDRSTDFGWYGVKTLQILTSSLLYPNELFSIASFIIHIEGCDTLKWGQASKELRETCSDRRKWGKNSLRLDQSQNYQLELVMWAAPPGRELQQYNHILSASHQSARVRPQYKCFCKCWQPLNDASELGFALFLLNRLPDAPQGGKKEAAL